MDLGFKVTCKEGEKSEVTVRVGEFFYFEYHRHGSVGFDADFEVEDDNIVELVRSECEYLYPERMKPGWTGGDKERCRWVFKALAFGETRINIRKLFRGDVESACAIVVKVTEGN